MTPTLVTGYVRLDSQHRGHDAYVSHGNRLLALGLPTIAFLDDAAAGVAPPPSTTVVPTSVEDCWLSHELDGVWLPPTGNPGKDTAAFHCVQHQKTAWLAEAARRARGSDLLVWIDFGIFHLPSVSEKHITDFVQALKHAPREKIAFASIWQLQTSTVINYMSPEWWIAGGVFVVPTGLAGWLDYSFRSEVRHTIATTGSISWEVNHLAAVARDRHHLCHLWPAADHDHTMFSYRP